MKFNKIDTSSKLFALVFAFICLSVTALCSTSVYAWYSINSEVEAAGLQMIAEVSPNLVISTTSDVQNLKDNELESYYISVTEGDDVPTKFSPCTRYDSGTPLSHLKYLSNTAQVDKDTGLTATPLLAEIPSSNIRNFYKDVVVYISSTGAAFSNYKLNASMSLVSKDDEDEYSYNAASIDFFVGDFDSSTESSHLIGTLNLAGKNAKINNSRTDQTTLTLADGNIPYHKASTNNCIKVTMRFYFDGALLSYKKTGPSDRKANKAYVNTATVNTENLTVKVSFSAVEK